MVRKATHMTVTLNFHQCQAAGNSLLQTSELEAGLGTKIFSKASEIGSEISPVPGPRAQMSTCQQPSHGKKLPSLH